MSNEKSDWAQYHGTYDHGGQVFNWQIWSTAPVLDLRLSGHAPPLSAQPLPVPQVGWHWVLMHDYWTLVREAPEVRHAGGCVETQLPTFRRLDGHGAR